MTPEEAVLGLVIEMLERRSIPYMVTGSFATSYHGRPRATHDADVVIDPTLPQLDGLLLDFEAAGFYVDPEGARDAFRHRRQFNVIEMARATKIDLILRKSRPFSAAEFERRQEVDLSFARRVAMVTPEDAILSKLEWARQAGDSERQIRDAAGVVELNPTLDRAYVSRWATALGVGDLWAQIAGSG